MITAYRVLHKDRSAMHACFGCQEVETEDGGTVILLSGVSWCMLASEAAKMSTYGFLMV